MPYPSVRGNEYDIMRELDTEAEYWRMRAIELEPEDNEDDDEP